ncbi:uncharacterized protein LOC127000511 isoform X2 [Eriocheir sinensis]|nr:uncharacterized protein LOC127000511 isoform X2 [Eriocheir sinensis]
MLRSAALRACRALAAASTASITSGTSATGIIGTRAERLGRFPHSTMSATSKPAEEEGLRWRFPADDRTQAMAASVEHGVCQSTILTFNSKAPITPGLMEEALLHLYGKVESLRLCFRLRDGQLWVADMPQPKLDFQVASNTDLVQEHSDLHKVPFDLHNGPLWNARLMPCPPDAPCHLPEVKAAYPHQCHLLMSVHHAANDGIVVLLMAELLFHILERLLEGSPVDTKPVGELRDGVRAREEENKIRVELESNTDRLLSALRNYSMSKRLPLLMETFGLRQVENPETLYFPTEVIDMQVLEKISKKCRSIGASLNSGLAAVFNMAMVELAREHGIKRDVYNISCKHPVDSRRLIKDCKNIVLGFHAIPFTQCTPTPHDVRKHFWQYVKFLDTELRDKLKRNYMCEERVLDAIMRPEGHSYEAQYTTKHLPDCDHNFSNMYAPNAPHTGIGKNIQITMARNYMSFHNEAYQFGQALAAFRGQARLQPCYSTAAYTAEQVQKLHEKNIASLHDVARTVD